MVTINAKLKNSKKDRFRLKVATLLCQEIESAPLDVAWTSLDNNNLTFDIVLMSTDAETLSFIDNINNIKNEKEFKKASAAWLAERTHIYGVLPEYIRYYYYDIDDVKDDKHPYLSCIKIKLVGEARAKEKKDNK